MERGVIRSCLLSSSGIHLIGALGHGVYGRNQEVKSARHQAVRAGGRTLAGWAQAKRRQGSALERLTEPKGAKPWQ